MAPVKGPSLLVTVVVTMLDDHDLLVVAMVPAAVHAVIAMDTHFGARAAAVMVAVTMHFAAHGLEA